MNCLDTVERIASGFD